jgi:hypothetical protein
MRNVRQNGTLHETLSMSTVVVNDMPQESIMRLGVCLVLCFG